MESNQNNLLWLFSVKSTPNIFVLSTMIVLLMNLEAQTEEK